MNDLTTREQQAVRTALRFLRLRVGAWGPLAKALRYCGHPPDDFLDEETVVE